MGKEKILQNSGKFLYAKGDTLYAQIGNYLCSSSDSGETWKRFPVTLPYGGRYYLKLLARLTRNGIHSILPLDNEKMVIVSNGIIFTVDLMQGTILNIFRVPRGSRPLFICQSKDGSLFWGEYFRNSNRDEVHIYTSDNNAETWRVIYTFKADRIRHVHGVFCDHHDDRIWVTTGDKDEESGIWITEDRFKTLEKVIGGNQQSRVFQLLFTKDFVYSGTDTPGEKNHIVRIHKNLGRKDELFEVESSVYWWCKASNWLFCSTAVEPSSVNTSRYASIWGSPDGTNWRCISKFKKDFWSMKYFQIGQVLFPQGENKTEYLFYTPFATEDDQTLRRIKIEDLM